MDRPSLGSDQRGRCTAWTVCLDMPNVILDDGQPALLKLTLPNDLALRPGTVLVAKKKNKGTSLLFHSSGAFFGSGHFLCTAPIAMGTHNAVVSSHVSCSLRGDNI